jgi:hypothetical protein
MILVVCEWVVRDTASGGLEIGSRVRMRPWAWNLLLFMKVGRKGNEKRRLKNDGAMQRTCGLALNLYFQQTGTAWKKLYKTDHLRSW